MDQSEASNLEANITNVGEQTKMDDERIPGIPQSENVQDTAVNQQGQGDGVQNVAEKNMDTEENYSAQDNTDDSLKTDPNTGVSNSDEAAEDSGDSQEDFVRVDPSELDLENSEGTVPKPDVTDTVGSSEMKTTEEKDEESDFVDILGNGSLTKKILVKATGEDSSKPQQGEWVEVTYEVYIAGQDNMVESEVNRKVCIHDMDIVQGIDFALMLMKCTEKAEICVSSDKAYGSFGRSSINVPPNADMKFILTLERICPTPEKDELLQIIETKKSRAKELFLGKDYESAVYIYSRCLRHLDEIDLGKSDIATSIKSNLAQGFLNMQRFDLALQHAMAVVNDDPENTKALLRLGKAYHKLGDLKRAERVLAKASNLEPNNKTIQNELNTVKTKSKKSRDNQKKTYGRMFGFEKSEKSKKSEKKEGNTQYYVAGAVVAAGVASLFYSVYKSLT